MIEIEKSIADQIGDIGAAVAEFKAALEAHKGTVDVPAPTADPIIEHIVKVHGGQFSVVPDGDAPPSNVVRPISPRQFYEVMILDGYMTDAQAEAALDGNLPAIITNEIAKLPAPMQPKARRFFKGAVEWHRDHEVTQMLGALKGWTQEELASIWERGASL